jgi:hypothetical protein
MPSTYSPRLRVELQATGENRSTWGDKANAVFSRLEEAVAGYTTIDLNNANYTLTTNNGSADEARTMMLNFSGALTAARTVTIPAVSKMYIIRNATTGGFNVNISNGTNSVAIPAGEWRLVWTTGLSIFHTMGVADLNADRLTSGTIPDARLSGAYTGVTSLSIGDGGATPLTLTRSSATNVSMEFKPNTGNSVFCGLSASGTFAVDGDSNLTSGPWLAITSTATSLSGTLTTALGITSTAGNITATAGELIANTSNASPVSMRRSSTTNVSVEARPSSGSSVFFGLGAASTFAVKDAASLTSAPWMTVTSSAVTATDFTATSDISLKENIMTIDGALGLVNRLRGVHFTRKGTGKKSIGFIAQEMETVFPELVTEDAEGVKSVSYGNITAALVEAVKELTDIVADQKRRIEALEAAIGA